MRHQTQSGRVYLHVSSPPSEAQQLLVLAGDEVDGGVLQQGREHEQQANGHPDVDGFYVGHLRRRTEAFNGLRRVTCVAVNNNSHDTPPREYRKTQQSLT